MWLAEETKYQELCRTAYNFRAPSTNGAASDYEILRAKINSDDQGLWEPVRHYIGRLGIWMRAVEFITSNAQNFASRLQNTTVCCVPYQSTSQKIQMGHDLTTVLHRVSPKLRVPQLEERTAAKMATAATLLRKLTKPISNSVVHVEAAMAHHFYMNEMSFVDEDHYIGCSKPSCYCCKLYLSKHGGGILPRQTSGNAYLKWYPPLILGKDEVSSNSVTIKTLRSMSEAIAEDVQLDAIYGRFGIKKPHDSTTGITTTAPEVRGADRT